MVTMFDDWSKFPIELIDCRGSRAVDSTDQAVQSAKRESSGAAGFDVYLRKLRNIYLHIVEVGIQVDRYDLRNRQHKRTVLESEV